MFAGGLLATVWGAWLLRPARSIFLPPQRWRAVPWSGWEILLVFFAYFFAVGISQGVLFLVPQEINFGRRDLWAQLFGSGIGFVAAIAIPYLLNQTRPYQLGLTRNRFGANVFLGVFAVFCLTPLVFGIHLLVVKLMLGLDIPPEEHSLTQLGKTRPPVLEWVLMALSATVAAPLIEEVLSRGLLLRWLATRRDRWAIAVAAALLFAVFLRGSKIQAALTSLHDWRNLTVQLQTTIFVVATVPPFLLLRRFVPSPIVDGVYGSSIVFAAAHAAVWPFPVPLFFLALGLGLVAYRTQSLVPSIVAHGVFNGFNLILLVFMTEKT